VLRLLAGRLSRHPERYGQLIRVVRKYRLHHVAASLELSHRYDEDDRRIVGADEPRDADAERLASALEELGPCFIKLGQLLSTRPDLLPAGYVRALGRLQDRLAPVPYDDVVATVEHELGRPLADVFASFEPSPLATASIAQVHRAVLRSGEQVVVKVQRPGVGEQVATDVDVLYEVAHFLTRHTATGARYGLEGMVRELEHCLSQEIDFRQEAENTRRIGQQLAEFGRLTTPAVHGAYTTRRVLVMSFVEGRHLAALTPEELAAIDARNIARELLSAYLRQIAIDGIFHCDPHPGNILVADDGRLALLDFGMVGRLDAGQRDSMILLLLAFSERQGQRVADVYLDLLGTERGFDRRAFAQDITALVSRYHDMSGGRMGLGTALLDLTRVANAHRVPVPTAMTLLGKAMLNLDGAIRVLSPELDPVRLIRDYMISVMRDRVMMQLSPGRDFAWLLDMKHLYESSPRRLEMLLDKLVSDQLHVRLEADRLDDALRAVQSAANRLSLGLVVGSAVIAGGLLLRTRRRRGG
jgi:predicted unusual protein kinase regulating ubiquinone biosynthesis (AarF/ABC1/UbiB family)